MQNKYYQYLQTWSMNLCFLYGEIVSELDYKFFYNNLYHNAQLSFELKVENQYIRLCAYDQIADKIYQNFKINDKIFIQGIVREQNIMIVYFEYKCFYNNGAIKKIY